MKTKHKRGWRTLLACCLVVLGVWMIFCTLYFGIPTNRPQEITTVASDVISSNTGSVEILGGAATTDAAADYGAEERSYEIPVGQDVMEQASGTDSVLDVTSGMVHYDGYLTIETLDFNYTLMDLKSLIASTGATVVSSQQTDDSQWYLGEKAAADGQKQIHLELRVNSGAFEEFMGSFSNVTGKIVSQSVSSWDQTRQYNSNEDRLEALRTEQEQLLRLMEETSDADSLVVLYEHLTDVNTEISSLETAQNEIGYDTEMSTVYVTVYSVNSYTDVVLPESVPFGTRLLYQMEQGWSHFVQGSETVLLGMASCWPVILLALIAICVVLIVVKKMVHKSKQKSDGNVKDVVVDAALDETPEKQPEEVLSQETVPEPADAEDVDTSVSVETESEAPNENESAEE